MKKRNVSKFLSDLVNLVDFNRRHRIEKKRPSPPSLIKNSSQVAISLVRRSSYTHVRTPIATLFFTTLSDYSTWSSTNSWPLVTKKQWRSSVLGSDLISGHTVLAACETCLQHRLICRGVGYVADSALPIPFPWRGCNRRHTCKQHK